MVSVFGFAAACASEARDVGAAGPQPAMTTSSASTNAVDEAESDNIPGPNSSSRPPASFGGGDVRLSVHPAFEEVRSGVRLLELPLLDIPVHVGLRWTLVRAFERGC